METLDDVGAGDLEEVLLFELLKHGAFDFDELIAHEESKQGVGVRVDSDVESDDLVEEGGSVNDVVEKCKPKHPQRTEDFTPSIGVAFERFLGKEAFQYVLS